MKTYEKPLAELVQFEAEEILLELQGLELHGDIGSTPGADGGVEDW